MDAKLDPQIKADIAESAHQIAAQMASIDNTVIRSRELIYECRELMRRVDYQLGKDRPPQPTE